jgi:hypothetical protein
MVAAGNAHKACFFLVRTYATRVCDNIGCFVHGCHFSWMLDACRLHLRHQMKMKMKMKFQFLMRRPWWLLGGRTCIIVGWRACVLLAFFSVLFALALPWPYPVYLSRNLPARLPALHTSKTIARLGAISLYFGIVRVACVNAASEKARSARCNSLIESNLGKSSWRSRPSNGRCRGRGQGLLFCSANLRNTRLRQYWLLYGCHFAWMLDACRHQEMKMKMKFQFLVRRPCVVRSCCAIGVVASMGGITSSCVGWRACILLAFFCVVCHGAASAIPCVFVKEPSSAAAITTHQQDDRKARSDKLLLWKFTCCLR